MAQHCRQVLQKSEVFGSLTLSEWAPCLTLPTFMLNCPSVERAKLPSGQGRHAPAKAAIPLGLFPEGSAGSCGRGVSIRSCLQPSVWGLTLQFGASRTPPSALSAFPSLDQLLSVSSWKMLSLKGLSCTSCANMCQQFSAKRILRTRHRQQ